MNSKLLHSYRVLVFETEIMLQLRIGIVCDKESQIGYDVRDDHEDEVNEEVE